MAAMNIECQQGVIVVLERLFHAIQSVTLQAIKTGHENGLGMRLMKCCNNWISQPLRYSQEQEAGHTIRCMSTRDLFNWFTQYDIVSEHTTRYIVQWNVFRSPNSSTVVSASLRRP